MSLKELNYWMRDADYIKTVDIDWDRNYNGNRSIFVKDDIYYVIEYNYKKRGYIAREINCVA